MGAMPCCGLLLDLPNHAHLRTPVLMQVHGTTRVTGAVELDLSSPATTAEGAPLLWVDKSATKTSHAAHSVADFNTSYERVSAHQCTTHTSATPQTHTLLCTGYMHSSLLHMESLACQEHDWRACMRRCVALLLTSLPTLQMHAAPAYDRACAVSLGDASSAFQDEGELQAQALVQPGSERPAKRQRLNNSRCFNCGSYAHSLQECPAPRDQQAIDTARRVQQEASAGRLPAGNVRYFGQAGATPGSSHKGKVCRCCAAAV